MASRPPALVFFAPSSPGGVILPSRPPPPQGLSVTSSSEGSRTPPRAAIVVPRPRKPRARTDLQPIAAAARRQSPQRSNNNEVPARHKLRALLKSETRAVYAGVTRTARREPADLTMQQQRLLLDPLARIRREQHDSEQQAARLARGLESKVDRMGGVHIPVAFLLEHRHVAFAERVVLRAMCRALERHLRRVTRAALASWKAQTVVLRVLEDHARHKLLVRQTTLAHAVAVVQRKHHVRLRELLVRWSARAADLRIAEQIRAAAVLQRCWRKCWLLARFKQLARAYRDAVRHVSATLIQSAARRCLARRLVRVLAAEHRRSVAAARIQRCYSSFQIRKIALRQRQRVAALAVQRCWRGACGRRRVRLRRQQIRNAAESVYSDLWRRIAVQTAVVVWCQARVIQRCGRAFLARCRLAHAAERGRRRRWCLPASRIQRAFRGFRARQLRATLSAAVGVVAARFECAAVRIQRAFRAFAARRRQHASTVLTALFRCFRAKRLAMRLQLAWLKRWSTAFLSRWCAVYAASPAVTKLQTRWRTRVATLERELLQLSADQRSARSRLQTRVGFRLLAAAKRFHRAFGDSHADAIRRCWRWHRLRVAIHAQVRAARQLHALLPLAFRCFARRRRRRRVLGRWRRQRFMALKAALQQWRAFHGLVREARNLRVSHDALRRVRWFRHQKLRKRVLGGWKAFVALRRARANRLERASACAATQRKRRWWRVWRQEQLPALTARNRLRELVALLCAWQALRAHWTRRTQLRRASAWRCVRLQRLAVARWKADATEMVADLQHAQRVSERRTLARSFSALRRHVAQLKRADELCGRSRRTRAVRQWTLYLSLERQRERWRQQSCALRDRHCAHASWRQWTRHVGHRRDHRRDLAQMAAFRERTQLQRAVRQWRVRVPMLADVRFTTRLADDVYRAQLQQRVFRGGFVRFWGLTVGARRVQMATRIQRLVRSRRARRTLFVLRTKLAYQLEARVRRGLDVRALTPDALRDAVQTSVWVFVLLSFPWRPVAPAARDAFSTVATNWQFLRQQRMAFGAMSATDAAAFAVDGSLDVGRRYSLLSWLGVAPHALPCVVAFWQGVSVAARCAVDTRGRPLARRFARVCGAAAEPLLVHQLGGTATDGAVRSLMQWIEALQRVSEDATAVDLQAIARGRRGRRLAHQRRAERREAMVRRLQRWLAGLRRKWRVSASNRAAARIQRWHDGVRRRRRFWRDVQAAMLAFRRAARALQRFQRRYLARERLRVACALVAATPARFEHAPLCEECLGCSCTTLELAALKCRECRQALCAACFSKSHASGKRLLHVADRIDPRAMNVPETRVCDACEVAACAKFCATCSEWRREDDGAAPAAFCASCFEVAHSEPHAVGANDAVTQQRRRKRSWWETQRFRTHAWTRVAPAEVAVEQQHSTAADVVRKYEWVTAAALRRQQDEQQRVERSFQAREDALFAARAQHEAILRDAFARYDRDGSGFIDRAELQRMFAEELCEPLRDEQVDAAMRQIDRSGDGRVEFGELLAWFAEGVVDRSGQAASSASELLKDALRAKRAMRRYREKLAEMLPPAPAIKDRLSRLDGATVAEAPAAAVPTVPGFPSVACLELRDYAAKRKVFFRFVKEVCGLAWVEEDEGAIPVDDARDVFARVFLPRWNAGQLTYDFYFDDEAFEFDGCAWRRQWDAQARRYAYHTRRRRQPPAEPPGGGPKPAPRRRSSRKKSARPVDGHAVDDEPFEDVVEPIDPRRKQLLLADAQRAFASADQDASGLLDAAEFHRMLVSELCEPMTRSQARAVLRQIDADRSGKVDFDEFFLWYATDKCQDYPTTAQMERVRGLLKTRRRARVAARAAVDAGVSGGLLLRQALAERLRAKQRARDSKGASAELVTLLYEGFPKALVSKALALHEQSVAAAREWLVEKQADAQQQEDAQRAARDERRAEKRQRVLAASARRKTRVAGVKRAVKLLVLGPNKKEAHAAKVENALQNLDREIQLVETQAPGGGHQVM